MLKDALGSDEITQSRDQGGAADSHGKRNMDSTWFTRSGERLRSRVTVSRLIVVGQRISMILRTAADPTRRSYIVKTGHKVRGNLRELRKKLPSNSIGPRSNFCAGISST